MRGGAVRPLDRGILVKCGLAFCPSSPTNLIFAVVGYRVNQFCLTTVVCIITFLLAGSIHLFAVYGDETTKKESREINMLFGWQRKEMQTATK